MPNFSKPGEEIETPVATQSSSQKDDREPKSGVSPAEVPYSPPPDDEAAKKTDRSYDWWRNAFAALALLMSLFALGISVASWRTAEKTFYTTHRAIVYLGLPDGKIGRVGSMGKGKDQGMELHFRNYGPTAAHKVVVEMWPVIMALVSRAYSEVIPPSSDKYGGPSLPPGFPLTISQRYSGATKEELDLGKKSLYVVGRISYRDSFSEYCEPFSVMYEGASEGFVPFVSMGSFICTDYDEVVRAEVGKTEDGYTWLYIGSGPYPQKEGPDQRGEK